MKLDRLRFLKPLALLSVLIGLACAPAIVVAPSSGTLSPGQGAVLVSLTSNSARAGQYDGVDVRQDMGPGQSGQNYHLVLVSPGLSRDTSLFVGALPPGEYSFTRITQGQIYIPLIASSGRLGKFKVESGKASDLGRLVLTGVNERYLLGRSALAVDNADLIHAFAPSEAPLLALPRGAGWVDPRHNDDQVEAYAQMTPVGADGLTELPDDYMAAGSRLGIIMVRRPSGIWEKAWTGSLSSLLWLVPGDNPDTRLVAVGEFDTIVRMDHRWRPSHADKGNLPEGNLFFIDGNDSIGWIVGHQRGQTITFYQSAKLDAGDWKPLLQDQVKNSIWSGADHAWAWHTPAGIAYATTFSGIKTYDRATGTWSTLVIPGNPNILSVSIQDQWSLLTSPGGGFGGIFATILDSSDLGKTWQEQACPFSVKIAPGCVLSGGKILQQGGPVHGQLQASEDGGKTWTPMPEGVSHSAKLVATRTLGIFAVDDGGASFGFADIKHSSDGGKTWELEYSNFSKAAYDREHPAAK